MIQLICLLLKFTYSAKATKFCKIFTVDLTGKSKVVILQTFCGILTKPQLYYRDLSIFFIIWSKLYVLNHIWKNRKLWARCPLWIAKLTLTHEGLVPLCKSCQFSANIVTSFCQNYPNRWAKIHLFSDLDPEISK